MVYELQIVKKPKRVSEPPEKITQPIEVFNMLECIRDEPQEHFVCITLDGGGNVITRKVITIGLLNHSLVHPREVFRGAILDNAASIIVAHNHPSGSLEPSPQDIAITTQLKDAGCLIGISLIDHIIVSKNGYKSFREIGLM